MKIDTSYCKIVSLFKRFEKKEEKKKNFFLIFGTVGAKDESLR